MTSMDATIPELFDAWVARDPDAVALIHGQRRVSYAELAELADRHLVSLRAAGLVAGDVVAVCQTRTIDTIATLLAALRAGAAYTMIDPRWPAARRDRIVEVLTPRVVVATEPIPGAPSWQPPAPDATVTVAREGIAARPESAAVIFFTSGSTGAPKAVAVPHRAFTRLFTPCEFAAFGPGVVQAQLMPMHWDGSILDVWGSLVCGGASVLVDEVLQPALVRRLIRDSGLNALGCLPPALFNMLVDEDVAAFAGVRFVNIGGERASGPHIGRFLAAHPRIALTNVYGPAECGVMVTARRLTAADATDPAGVPLGHVVAASVVLVLDGELPCATGETGEICLGGSGLALGYFGDPALTAERFVTLPVDGVPTRLYRTGDLGHFSPDGVLYFHGRDDDQFKIRSHRIEPGEIERTAERLPGLARAAVVPVAGPDGVAHALALYYVSAPAGGLEADAVAGALRTELPGYLVPQHIQRLDELPLTLNNKIDRDQLRALAATQASTAQASATQASATQAAATQAAAAQASDGAASAAAASGTTPIAEGPTDPAGAAGGERQLLTTMFRELTGATPGGTDSFFQLGASSLDAARLCARITAALNKTIPVSQVYRTPSIDALTAWLATAPTEPDSGTGDADAVTANDSGPEPTGNIPLTTGQAGTTFSAPGSVCLVSWWLEGTVDRTALAAAVNDVHRRHETLHASYHQSEPPVASLPGQVGAAEFIELPDAPTRAAAERLVEAQLERPLELADGAIWRSAVVSCGNGTLFGVGVHHVAFDGWSQALLIEELGVAYAARLAGHPPRWEHPAPGLAALAREEQRRRDGLDPATQLDFWVRQLRGVPRLPLPGLPRGIPPHWGPKEGRLYPLDDSQLAQWDEAAAAVGASRFACHAAILAEVLRRITGHADVAMLVPVAMRGSPLLDRAIACRTDPVVLRLRRPTRPGSDPLVPVVDAVNAAMAAQDVPFGTVLRNVAALRADLDSILTLPTFVLQDNQRPALNLAGCTATDVAYPVAHEVQAPLTIELYPQPGGAVLRLTARTDLLSVELLDRIAEGYAELLSAGPAALDPRVAVLSS